MNDGNWLHVSLPAGFPPGRYRCYIDDTDTVVIMPSLFADAPYSPPLPRGCVYRRRYLPHPCRYCGVDLLIDDCLCPPQLTG